MRGRGGVNTGQERIYMHPTIQQHIEYIEHIDIIYILCIRSRFCRRHALSFRLPTGPGSLSCFTSLGTDLKLPRALEKSLTTSKRRRKV